MKRIAKLLSIALLWQFSVLIVAPTGHSQTSSNSAPVRKRIVGQQDQSNLQELKEGEALKIDVELVQVIFSVVDAQNRLVTDLQQSDIEIYDSGQRQQIDLFQRSNSLPMVLAVLLDMSASQEFLLPDEKIAVETFFDSFFREGKDYGAILTFQGDTMISAGLTSNLKRLKTALKRVRREQDFRDEDGGVPKLGTALYDAIEISAREVLDGKTAQRITSQSANSTQSSARAAIRRAMILLTDGIDTASELTIIQALRNAQRLGIAIYALGMGDRFRFSDVNQQTLDQLCQETGGRAFYPKSESDLNYAFKQIAAELSSQYILAYYPRVDSNAQGFREIEIKLPKRNGWRVLHRRGYVPEEP
ncbi:MAG: VWA domain-containing protein [Acidobacteriota bacterium]